MQRGQTPEPACWRKGQEKYSGTDSRRGKHWDWLSLEIQSGSRNWREKVFKGSTACIKPRGETELQENSWDKCLPVLGRVDQGRIKDLISWCETGSASAESLEWGYLMNKAGRNWGDSLQEERRTGTKEGNKGASGRHRNRRAGWTSTSEQRQLSLGLVPWGLRHRNDTRTVRRRGQGLGLAEEQAVGNMTDQAGERSQWWDGGRPGAGWRRWGRKSKAWKECAQKKAHSPGWPVGNCRELHQQQISEISSRKLTLPLYYWFTQKNTNTASLWVSVAEVSVA